MFVIKSHWNAELEMLNGRTYDDQGEALAAIDAWLGSRGRDTVHVAGADAEYVYYDQERADRDQDGSRAIAIVEVQS